jgi:uncharacterized protein (TIGR03437 family)
MRSVFFLIFSTLAIAGEYTTYIGDAYPRSVAAIATDAAGNTYVAGNRGPSGVPTAVIIVGNPFSFVPSNSLLPPNDVFVSKIDPSGKVLFTNSFAGKGADQALAVAVDPSGNIYVAGTTTSPDFPISNALQPQPGQFGTGFIVKLSADGKTILYSTYFGGVQGPTSVNAMTTDPAGNLYLTGATGSTDFPVTIGTLSTGSPQGRSGFSQVVFVTAISAAGDKILFSGAWGDFASINCPPTPFGCDGISAGTGIALDAARNVYFGGNTNTVIPTTQGALVSKGLGAFVGKVAVNGPALAYLTYLSPGIEFGREYTGATQLSSLAVDAAGNSYLAGTTGDPKFPATAGAYQSTFAGGPVDVFGNPANTDGFLAKLKPDGSGLVWATYLGGSGNDAVKSIAVDAAGNVWATGTTASANFPNAQGWSQGGDFLVEFNPNASALSYAARYPTGTVSQAVALDSTLFVHTAGVTGILSEIASTGPPTPKIFGIGNAAGSSLAGHVSPAEVISIYGPHIGPATPAIGSRPVYPTALAGVRVTIGGIAAPLLYVSDTQINAVVPMGVTQQAAATIQIANGNTTAAAYPVWIDMSDPAVFPGVLNQNGTLNSPTNPAKVSSTVSFYATGWQSDFSPLTDGQVASGAINMCFGCGASQGSIVYAGAAPGIVAGVTQFNLQLNGGSQPVKITALQQVTILVSGLNQFITIWVTP